MARPQKQITQQIKSRNNAINDELARHILTVASEAAAIQATKIYSADTYYLAHEILSDTITSLLTSDNFNPDSTHDTIARYIRCAAKRKMNSKIKSHMKNLEWKIKLDQYIKVK